MAVVAFADAAPLVLGAIAGITYGLLAIGLILVYRSSKLVNFAQGAVGTFGAAVVGVVVLNNHLPYWLLFPAGVAVGAGSSMLVELVAARRLRRAPMVMTVVATLGMAAFFAALTAELTKNVTNGALYPEPSGFPSFPVGSLLITPAYSAQLILSPIVVIALSLFLRFSRYGIAIRAAASNDEAATLSGISPAAMASIAWAVAGGIAAYAAILAAPSQGVTTNSNLGTGVLLRALTIAVAAGLSNLPVALLLGVVVGAGEELLLWHGYSSGDVDLLLFAVIFVMLALRSRHGRERAQGSWLALQAWPPAPRALSHLWSVRWAGRAGSFMVLLLLVAADLGTNKSAATLTITIAFALVGVSVWATCGLIGQLSLGQFALAGIGAATAFQLTQHGVNFGAAVLVAAVFTAPCAVLLAFTALRVTGLMLTVATLALAVACQSWLLQQSWALGQYGASFTPDLFGLVGLNTSRRYYLFALVVFALAIWLSANVSRTGLARVFVAVRDNEDAARAFGIRVTRRKVQAFAFAGMLAGLGGAVYAGSLFSLGSESFPPDTGITIVAMSAIGGITLLLGSLLGALYLVALPGFFSFGPVATATSTVGWLVLILYFPGGGAQLLRPVRDRVLTLLGRLHGLSDESIWDQPRFGESQFDIPSSFAADLASRVGTRLAAETTDPSSTGAVESILGIHGLSKRFGGLAAVASVSFDLQRSELLGLIGPNGAGKTTLFEMISGFVTPDDGSVVLEGRDITRLAPEQRAAVGLVRSFQDARLFPTLSALDVVQLAFERENPTAFAQSLAGRPRARRQQRTNRAKAHEVLAFMGIDRYADATIGTLSTGTRRVVELACILALEPRVLLLDEPSAGLAQRETEALASLLELIRGTLGSSIVVIEHDIPLITATCDRVIAMNLGQVIASGAPRDVVAHPNVIASYLGDDPVAIARSGRQPQPEPSTRTSSGGGVHELPAQRALCSEPKTVNT